MGVKELVGQLEQSGEGIGVGKEQGESIACQILLLTLLMEVRSIFERVLAIR